VFVGHREDGYGQANMRLLRQAYSKINFVLDNNWLSLHYPSAKLTSSSFQNHLAFVDVINPARPRFREEIMNTTTTELPRRSIDAVKRSCGLHPFVFQSQFGDQR
jgi:hypothetical protein